MLVDNGVEGDSRVQKQARSMADRGWDVVLLGSTYGEKTRRWRIGEARVRLVPVVRSLIRRPYEMRPAPLRSPLAFGEERDALLRLRLAEARVADAVVRTARQAERVRSQGSSRALPGRLVALLARRRAQATLRLAEKRHAATVKLRTTRRAGTSPIDQLSAWWWKTTMRDRAWRRLDPHLWDWEAAFGPVIDELKPDLIHANDGRMLGVGARATLRARHAGRATKLVFDAHEWLPGRYIHQAHHRWHDGQLAHEAEYVGDADAVVTVSEMMIELLVERYGLTAPTSIVRNAPLVGPDGPPAPDGPTIRELCGLADDVPLVLYVGAAAPQRGCDLMVEALPQLPDVHTVFLAKESAYVTGVRERAAELGVADRFHVQPYVPIEQIVPHIATATIGVFAGLRELNGTSIVNHDVDLPTKFYEYAHARLPMVVSDMTTTGGTVRELGIGEVCTAGDLGSYVEAVRRVLADLPRYRAAYDAHADLLAEWTWERQADVLDEVYASLVGQLS